MASAQAMFSTLQHVTETKLVKLERRSKEWDHWKEEAYTAAAQQTQPIDKVNVLLQMLLERNHKFHDENTSHNISRFIAQAASDPSIPPSLIESWNKILTDEIEHQSARYDYTELFAHLVSEWIRTSKGQSLKLDNEDSDDSEFEPVGRKEMHEQRLLWESYAFQEVSTDPDKITKYLDTVFTRPSRSNRLQPTPLDKLRKDIARFEGAQRVRFDATNIAVAIDALLREDLFVGDKRNALLDLKTKKSVLIEIADVLNSDLEALESWQWEPSTVPLHVRKQINGKYRVYMDEELYQAIFVQLIGTLWAVHLRMCFNSFRLNGNTFKCQVKSPLDKTDKARRKHFLGSEYNGMHGVWFTRRDLFHKQYFMTQLPSTLKEATRSGGYSRHDEEVNEDGKNGMNSGQVHTSAPGQVRQAMLRLITTEMLLSLNLDEEFSYWQSDFKWWGPSVSHSTLLTVLRYLHFPSRWIRFFETFLRPKLSFAQDGQGALERTRVRGIPMSHTLSTALGETLLFVLDFAINQATNGMNLYRFYDDLHFFGSTRNSILAWNALTEFAKVMGLELNEEKSAAVVCSSSGEAPPVPDPLPQGIVRWGFLQLSHRGVWIVDDEKVRKEVVEFKRQLDGCQSVFAFVQAYNAYMIFFLNNLGRPANCLGRQHVQMVISTITQIQQQIFSSLSVSDPAQSSITGYLRDRIRSSRVLQGAEELDIPEAFFFWPVAFGGLEIRNPLFQLLSTECNFPETPNQIVLKALQKDEDDYEHFRHNYLTGKVCSDSSTISQDAPFMSLAEFNKSREESSMPLGNAWQSLMSKGTEKPIVATGVVGMELAELVKKDRTRAQAINHRWALEMYGREVLDRVGGPSLGERDLLPTGLVELLRTEKVRWLG